jgi:APA family basic amino acid/polyamine antiporter
MAMLIAMFFVNVSAFVLVRNENLLDISKRHFRIPFGPLFPILGAVSCIIISLTIAPENILIGFIALFIGTVLYAIEDTPEGEREVEKINKLLNRQTSGMNKSDDVLE